MNYDINTLRDTFYREGLYHDYKDSFLNIQSGSWCKGQYYKDIYTQTLKKSPYNIFEKGGRENNLGKITDDLKDEKRVCASVEKFFEIIKDNDEAKNYVWSLMRFMKDTTTKTKGGWLMVEDNINRLILKYFWGKLCQDTGMEKDKEIEYTVYNPDTRCYDKKTACYTKYCQDITKNKDYDTIRIMVSLAETLNICQQNIDFFERHLNKSRIVRNKVTHDKLLPQSTADAIVVLRFKLFSYIATVLILQPAEVELETKLILQDMTDKQNAEFKVWELNNGTPIEIKLKKNEQFGWECSILKFHTYRIEVLDASKQMRPDSYSHSPSGTWDGSDLQLYNDMNEQVASQPAGSLFTLQKIGGDMAQALKSIDGKLTELIGIKEKEVRKEKSCSQEKQLTKAIELLFSLQKSFSESSERQAKTSEEMQQQLISVNERFSQLIEKSQGMIDAINNGNSQSTQKFELTLKNILETERPILAEIAKEQEEKQVRSKRLFFMWHLPLWLVLVASAIGCAFHCMGAKTIYWMTYKTWYIIALILVPLLLAGGLLLLYHTTRRKELVTRRVKMMDWGTIGLATLLWGTAIAVTPHPKSDEEYIQNYWWGNKDFTNQKFMSYLQDYLAKHPDSEVARVKLAEYYLDYSGDIEKALEVTKPMRDVVKYSTGCMYAANALYESGDQLAVKDIIDRFEETHPKHTLLGLERLNALLKIEGKVVDPNPDEGLKTLYNMVASDSIFYPEASYDLGHWAANDLDNWNFGESHDVMLRYDIPTAVYYLRKVANNMPKAALELGTIYDDLGVSDSAQHYFLIASTLAEGSRRDEALYRLGVLQECQGRGTNNYMEEALLHDYSPAVLHKALKENNHRTAIARMKRAGRYSGYRTIPPIVFEYLYCKEGRGFTNLADSALQVLQSERPECCFNREFVNGMEAFLGTPRTQRDLTSAWEQMRFSADKGCLYAKMMCCWKDINDQISTSNDTISINMLKPLYTIQNIIPFANVLLCDIYIKTGNYELAVMQSQYSIARNHPAGALILSSIPPKSYPIMTFGVEPNEVNAYVEGALILLNSYYTQKIVRLSPYKNRWLMDAYNADVNKRAFFSSHLDSSQVSMFWQRVVAINNKNSATTYSDHYYSDNREGTRLWTDVIAASNDIYSKLKVSFFATTDTLQRERLVLSALNDLNEDSAPELWETWHMCFSRCSQKFQLDLCKKNDNINKRQQDFVIKLMRKDWKPSVMALNITDAINLNIQPITLLDEFSSFIEETKNKRRDKRFLR